MAKVCEPKVFLNVKGNGFKKKLNVDGWSRRAWTSVLPKNYLQLHVGSRRGSSVVKLAGERLVYEYLLAFTPCHFKWTTLKSVLDSLCVCEGGGR